ncbi:hypothetical protein LTR51_000028 [Lithohypha guttulata]|nr:hypothetical protein LTR51_000028 [Lithohypha guttulata]
MAAYGFAAEDRDPGRTYTPTHSSDEDLPQLSSLSLSERRYRLFTLRKDGRSWIQHSSSESRLSESEIKKRASRSSKASHSVAAQLQKMSPPRRNAVEGLVERVNRRDVNGDVWDLYAIHNDQPEVTKKTGEVLSFSIVLNKVNPTRQRTNSMSQERRRSAYISPTQEYAMPTRRGSKSYYTSHTNPIHDSNAARQSQSFRTSQTILENDPFGNATLFSKDGKPVVTPGTAAYPNAGLPPHIPLDEPIGAPVRDETEKKDGKPKKTKGNKDDDVIDLDALLGGSFNDDVLGGHSHDKHHKGHEHQDDDDFDFDSPIEIVGENHGRGRKQNEKGWGSKTPKQGLSRSRSRPKFKQQRFSSSMPRDGRGQKSSHQRVEESNHNIMARTAQPQQRLFTLISLSLKQNMKSIAARTQAMNTSKTITMTRILQHPAVAMLELPITIDVVRHLLNNSATRCLETMYQLHGIHDKSAWYQRVPLHDMDTVIAHIQPNDHR